MCDDYLFMNVDEVPWRHLFECILPWICDGNMRINSIVPTFNVKNF